MAPITTLVDTTGILERCISQLSSSKQVAVDLEGVRLSREGRISIIQLFAKGSNTVWLVDVTTLKARAFSHHNADGHSLASVLESDAIMKVFFDVRNDADALYNLHGIDMKNVYDVQLLEVAYRRIKKMPSARHIIGLGKCVEEYLSMPRAWQAVKYEGRRLFDPKGGGSYEVFERRPLHPKLVKYCAQDAAILFDLQNRLLGMIGDVAYGSGGWMRRIKVASTKRVNLSKSKVYEKKNPFLVPSF